MPITDDLNAATGAQNGLAAQWLAERAAILAGIPAGASADELIAGLLANKYVSPLRLIAALASGDIQIGGSRTLYVDAVGGDDTASGKTALAPLKTLERALALSSPAQFLTIRLMSDVVITQGCYSRASTLQFLSEGTKRKITIAASALVAGSSPACAVSIWGNVILSNVDLDIGAMPGTLACVFGTLNTVFSWYSGILNFQAGGTAVPLFSGVSTTFFSGVTFNAGFAGRMFSGVAAGTNPNSTFPYRSSLTTA